MTTALFLILPVLFMGLVGWGTAAWDRRQRLREQVRHAEAAQLRGWGFQVVREGGQDVMRWDGVTEGVRWSLRYQRGRRRRHGSHQRRHSACWCAEGLSGPSHPVLLMGVSEGQEIPASMADGDGMVARIARQAATHLFVQALVFRFGEAAVRAANPEALRPLEAVQLPGFLVMAAQADEARRHLANRGAILETLHRNPLSALGRNQGRPWVLWLPGQLQVAQTEMIVSADDVARLVGAGVALAR